MNNYAPEFIGNEDFMVEEHQYYVHRAGKLSVTAPVKLKTQVNLFTIALPPDSVWGDCTKHKNVSVVGISYKTPNGQTLKVLDTRDITELEDPPANEANRTIRKHWSFILQKGNDVYRYILEASGNRDNGNVIFNVFPGSPGARDVFDVVGVDIRIQFDDQIED